MSGIGSLRWLNEYIGIPYKFGGRDVNGTDCYGLIKMIYLNEYNEVLPDWAFDEINYREIDGKIQAQLESGTFCYLDEPQDASFAICFRTRAAHHIGLYYGGGIIHCADGIGTVFQQRRVFEDQFVRVVYGNWTP